MTKSANLGDIMKTIMAGNVKIKVAVRPTLTCRILDDQPRYIVQLETANLDEAWAFIKHGSTEYPHRVVECDIEDRP
jgi:hypothetical protein